MPSALSVPPSPSPPSILNQADEDDPFIMVQSTPSSHSNHSSPFRPRLTPTSTSARSSNVIPATPLSVSTICKSLHILYDQDQSILTYTLSINHSSSSLRISVCEEGLRSQSTHHPYPGASTPSYDSHPGSSTSTSIIYSYSTIRSVCRKSQPSRWLQALSSARLQHGIVDFLHIDGAASCISPET